MKDRENLLAELIRDSIDELIRMGRYRTREEALDDFDPAVSICGFLKIAGVIRCGCGEMVTVCAEPKELTPEKMKELRQYAENHDDITVKDVTVGNPPEDEEVGMATNVGHITQTCEKCGRRLLATWKMEAGSVNGSVSFPWEDQESPDLPASGPMNLTRPRGSTVH
jgi:hypothetical protein